MDGFLDLSCQGWAGAKRAGMAPAGRSKDSEGALVRPVKGMTKARVAGTEGMCGCWEALQVISAALTRP